MYADTSIPQAKIKQCPQCLKLKESLKEKKKTCYTSLGTVVVVREISPPHPSHPRPPLPHHRCPHLVIHLPLVLLVRLELPLGVA